MPMPACRAEKLWLHGVHIAAYDAGSYMNHDPRRPRKVLLHREQIRDFGSQVAQKGLTLTPLRMYLKNHNAKIELGVGSGQAAIR